MASALAQILKQLKNLWALIASVLGTTNAVGWGVSVAVVVAVIAIWVTVLTYVNGFLAAYLGSLSVDIFGVGLPAGAVYLINQAFPLQLFFNLTVSLIVFRLTAAKLVMLAITATRRLKS